MANLIDVGRTQSNYDSPATISVGIWDSEPSVEQKTQFGQNQWTKGTTGNPVNRVHREKDEWPEYETSVRGFVSSLVALFVIGIFIVVATAFLMVVGGTIP